MKKKPTEHHLQATHPEENAPAVSKVPQAEPPTETPEPDSLVSLIGSVKIDPADYYDPSMEKALQAEIRSNIPESIHDMENPPSFFDLLGSLKCEVTDISERHDDYIGAALLRELRGDTDE